jgi:hypothetical protein
MSDTVFAPAVPAGVTAVTVVAFTTDTLVAAVPPIVTELVPVKFVPVIVIAVPPAVDPADGDTDVIAVGASVPSGVLATRNPELMLTPAWLRAEERKPLNEKATLKEPPRDTRPVPVVGPVGFVDGLAA